MLKKKVKRVDIDSLPPGSVDEKSGNTINFQRLLQAFLDLQKDNVTKKRRLRTAKKSRDVLLAEVRFLRQRHKELMKMQPNTLVPEEKLLPQQDPPPTLGKLVLKPTREESREVTAKSSEVKR
ncbi:hypothetical protein Tsubulata_042306 [Turnera subulata]|uniref:Uncharacterized protein n=1 Tax=Turnera subulata TaxID=218843 RepID=A0A9Q0FYM1_9ROSI|nr:hypothetical protein Tsubulata_042306 [Turnera subulata]